MPESKVEAKYGGDGEQVLRFGVTDFGRFEIRGSKEFILASADAIHVLTVALLVEHIRRECKVKGRDIEEVRKEFLDAWHSGVSAAMASPGDLKHVSLSVG